ncbi:MAG TPA: hypothetical protein VLE91_05005 [Candidatus Saccharimonadales bacterium]|nr:hypothetical protein [Candidatus Saccharimonadales bacterium]
MTEAIQYTLSEKAINAQSRANSVRSTRHLAVDHMLGLAGPATPLPGSEFQSILYRGLKVMANFPSGIDVAFQVDLAFEDLSFRMAQRMGAKSERAFLGKMKSIRDVINNAYGQMELNPGKFPNLVRI